jgi:acetylornithine deacetylase
MGAVSGDRIYGRGASDMKSGLVAALETFEVFARGPYDFPGRVMFVAVPAEEDSGLGTLAAIRRGWTADAAIIPEPTLRDGSPDVVIAHSGAMSCTIEIMGRAAHASKRLRGENALDHYLAIHSALRRAEKELNEGEAHPLMQELTLPYATNIGAIRGGEWSSTVMDRLEVDVRIGVALGETTTQAKQRFERVLQESAQESEWLREHPPVVRWKAAGFGSAETKSDHPLVEYLADASQVEFGREPTITAAPYGCDMSGWVRLGHTPTVLYGPGDIEVAHAADEWVSMAATEKVARSLIRCTSALLERDDIRGSNPRSPLSRPPPPA